MIPVCSQISVGIESQTHLELFLICDADLGASDIHEVGQIGFFLLIVSLLNSIFKANYLFRTLELQEKTSSPQIQLAGFYPAHFQHSRFPHLDFFFWHWEGWVTPDPSFAELPLAFLQGKFLPRAPGSEGCAKGNQARKNSGSLQGFKSCCERQRGCSELRIHPEWMQQGNVWHLSRK